MSKNNKKSKVAEILKVIGIAGMVIVALSHPRGGQVVMRSIEQSRRRKELKLQRSEFAKYLWYLRKKKYVEVVKHDGQNLTIKITGRGIERTKKFDLENLTIKPMEKWDSKWRLVLFDIPSKKKNVREVLRRKLEELGFYRMQKSVYVCPWECIDEIVFLRKMFEVEPYVSIVLADAIDEEMRLRKLFNISTF